MLDLEEVKLREESEFFTSEEAQSHISVVGGSGSSSLAWPRWLLITRSLGCSRGSQFPSTCCLGSFSPPAAHGSGMCVPFGQGQSPAHSVVVTQHGAGTGLSPGRAGKWDRDIPEGLLWGWDTITARCHAHRESHSEHQG